MDEPETSHESYTSVLKAGISSKTLDANASDLDRARALEELSLQWDVLQVANVMWLLRTKQLEAQDRAAGDRGWGHGASALGMALALLALGTLFHGLAHVRKQVIQRELPAYGDTPAFTQVLIPDQLWMLIVATTAGTLLIGGAGTLLFKVAQDFYRRERSHAADADRTRDTEAAVRAALAADALQKPDGALGRLSQTLAGTGNDEPGATGSELSAVLGQLTEVIAAAKKAIEAIKPA